MKRFHFQKQKNSGVLCVSCRGIFKCRACGRTEITMKKKLLSLLLALCFVGGVAITGIPEKVTAAASTGAIVQEEYTDTSKVFLDVGEDAWYKRAVDYVYTYGIMRGDAPDVFLPEAYTTRGMVVTALHRIEGTPQASSASPFVDLTQDWYVDAINWAHENDIVDGKSPTEFDPDANITRQELAALFHHYVKYKNLPVKGVMDIEGYADYGEVALDWAEGPLLWAVAQGFVRGRETADGPMLAPNDPSTRAELATLFLRLSERYDLLKAPQMTIEDVMADIKSSRTKKVILDCDAGNEMDDQYAVAYALGSDKMDVIAANGSLFYNDKLVSSFKEGMEESTREIKRVMNMIGVTDVPVYYGSPEPLNSGLGLSPIKNDASDNIIKTAHETDELLYIITTGAGTNIATAILTDPSIMDKICVIWIGGIHPDDGYSSQGEYNVGQDLKAAQFIYNCGVNFVMVPGATKKGHAMSSLVVTRADMFAAFPGNDAASKFFRETLPMECDGTFATNPNGWSHVMWDIAGPGVLDLANECTFEIVKAPRLRNDGTYAHRDNEHKVGVLCNLNPQSMMRRAWDCINEPKSAKVTLSDALLDIFSDRRRFI